MKGRAIKYSDAELAWAKENATRPRAEAHAEFQQVFGRPDVSASNFKSLCKRNGWTTGRKGCFEKGMTPFNKGRKGYCAPGSEKGWIKPGTRMGRANQNYKPIGFERVTKDGYLSRKVNDGLPFKQRWRLLHIINWEAVNGPTPDGHALKCLDGNKLNTSPENWTLVPRAMLPRLAGGRRKHVIPYDSAPPELRPAIMATARLEYAVRERMRQVSGVTQC